jgi:hypothetical protein
MRAIPTKESAEPRRDKDLNDSEEPTCEKPRTATEAPRRAKDLKDKELPISATSITDRENKDPNRAIPKTDTEDASRM